MINPTVEQLVDGSWFFTWPVSEPPYQLWLDGYLIATVDDEEYTFVSGATDYEDVPPDIEIVDSASNAPTPGNLKYPPFIRIQWRGTPAAYCYLIQHYEGSQWVTVHTRVIGSTDQGYYNFTSPALMDGVSHQYRVVPADILGNLGTPIAFTVALCRHPLHPTVEFSVSSAGNIVVSEG